MSKISFFADMHQGNEELEYKKVCSRISCEAPKIEKFYQDIPRMNVL